MGPINWNPSQRELRQFGAAGFVVFGVLGTALAWGGANDRGLTIGGYAGLALLGLGIACGVLALVAPRPLRSLYLAMTVLAWPIGWVVSHVALAIVFFGVFTPIAVLFRLIGRDALSLKREGGSATYWTPRQQRQDVRGYFRQS